MIFCVLTLTCCFRLGSVLRTRNEPTDLSERTRVASSLETITDFKLSQDGANGFWLSESGGQSETELNLKTFLSQNTIRSMLEHYTALQIYLNKPLGAVQ